MELASAPGAFENLMEVILAGLFHDMVLLYLHDVVVFGRSFDEHLKRLELVLKRVAENGLKTKESKSIFFQKCVSFLGHFISESGVEVNPEKVRAVERTKEPSSLKDVRVFLCLVGYHLKITPGFREQQNLFTVY